MTNRSDSRLAGLVLAAGASARLGEPKQLLVWQGLPLIAHAVKLALSACEAGVTVVIGAHAQQIEAAIAGYPIRVVRNPDWEQGIGRSLRFGIESLAETEAGAALVLLSDQPLIGLPEIERLVGLWREQPAEPAATRYNDAIGVPAIFPRGWFERLEELAGDRGAGHLLSGLPEHRLLSNPAAELDIDTPEDLLRLQQHLSSNI